jgi:acyl-CoA thioesterase
LNNDKPVAADELARACAAEMYSNDPASQALGITIENVACGYAEAVMTVRADMVNGHDICHGGYLFTLADTAFAFACNTRNEVTVAASASIEFLVPAQKGDRLTAIAEERSRSRRSGVFDVAVRRDDGTLLALFRGRSRSRPDPLLPAATQT